MKLETEEIIVTDDTHFESMGVRYNIKQAVEKDIELILNEAETSHKDELDRLYDKDGIKPEKVRVFMSNDMPVFAMVTYIIPYRDGLGGMYASGRYACGNYYPIYEEVLWPHPYQGSICW